MKMENQTNLSLSKTSLMSIQRKFKM